MVMRTPTSGLTVFARSGTGAAALLRSTCAWHQGRKNQPRRHRGRLRWPDASSRSTSHIVLRSIRTAVTEHADAAMFELAEHRHSVPKCANLTMGVARGAERISRVNDTMLAAWKTTLACARRLRARRPSSFDVRRTSARPTRTRGPCVTSSHAIDRPSRMRFLREPRGPWPDELVTSLCRELALVHTVDPFLRPSLTPELDLLTPARQRQPLQEPRLKVGS
jgi:hypothetical protein